MAIDTTDTATIHIFNKRGPGRPKVKLESAQELNKQGQARFRAEKRAAGLKQSTVWLSAESIEAIKQHQEAEGLSKDVAINELIEAGLKAKQ